MWYTRNYRTLLRIVVFLIAVAPCAYAQLEIKLSDGKTLQGKIVSETEATITLRTYLQKRQEYADIILDKTNIVQVYDIINDADVSGKYRLKSNQPANGAAAPQSKLAEPPPSSQQELRPETKSTEMHNIQSERGWFAFGIAGGYSTVSQRDWNEKFIEAELENIRRMGVKGDGASATSGYPLSAFVLMGLSKHLRLELAGMFLKVNSRAVANDLLYNTVTQEYIKWSFEDNVDFYHIDGSIGVRYAEPLKINVLDAFLRVAGGIAYSRFDREADNIFIDLPSESHYIINRGYAYIPFGRLGVGLEYHAGVSGVFVNVGYRYVVPRDVDEGFKVVTRISRDGNGIDTPVTIVPVDYDMSGWELMLGVVFYL